MEDDQRSRHEALAAGNRRPPLIAAALAASARSRAVVLVEGTSDQRALEALAARRGRDLDAEGVSIVSIGGAGMFGRVLELLSGQGRGVGVVGLYDEGEEGQVRRGLARAGFGADLTRPEMETLGFYVCVADLEDELIRSIGAVRVEHVIAAHGDLGAFRTLQKQPAQRRRTVEEQLHRFMGTRAGRKSEYAAWLVEELDLDQVPRPLDGVLAHVWSSAGLDRAPHRLE